MAEILSTFATINRLLNARHTLSKSDQRRALLDECQSIINVYNDCIAYIQSPDDIFATDYKYIIDQFILKKQMLNKSPLRRAAFALIMSELDNNIDTDPLYTKAHFASYNTDRLTSAMFNKCMGKREPFDYLTQSTVFKRDFPYVEKL